MTPDEQMEIHAAAITTATAIIAVSEAMREVNKSATTHSQIDLIAYATKKLEEAADALEPLILLPNQTKGTADGVLGLHSRN